MARKMPHRLVALSASAVVSIYAAGLLATQPAAQTVAAASAAPEATAIAAPATTVVSTPVVVVGASTYANGTYSGTGSSRFGNVSVSVTVSNGNISNVQITRVTTSFPMSRIASLPTQVVQNQTANINGVSGATYSSQAFKQAVQAALAQASPTANS